MLAGWGCSKSGTCGQDMALYGADSVALPLGYDTTL